MAEPLRVLILEDDPDDAELMVHELSRAGFEPDWVRVDTEADYLAQLGADYDLILSDYTLPQFDGLQALALMQQRGLDIPFIIVTGSIEETAIECMKQGASDYLLKDRLARLGPSVKNALDRTRLRNVGQRAEEALRESEERYRLLTEKSVTGIYIIQDAKMAYVNPSLARMFGYDADEIIGKLTPGDLIHPDDIGIVMKRLQERLEGLVEPGSTSYRALNKDGSVIYIEVYGVQIEYQGRPAVMGTLIDVTPRKQAEEAQKSSEEATRSMLQQLTAVNQIGMSIAAGLDLEQLMLNLYAQCQQIGDTDTFYVALYDNATQTLSFPVYFKDGERRSPEARNINDNTGFSGHIVRQRQTLHIRDTFDLSSEPIPVPEPIRQPGEPTRSFLGIPLLLDDRIVGVLSMQSHSVDAYTAEQVTTLEMLATQIAIAIKNSQLYQQSQRELVERKQAEKSLRESEAYTRNILDNLPIGVAVNLVNPMVTFTYMNDNFVRYYRTTKQALARPDAFWEAVYEDPEVRKEISQRVLDDCATGDPERMHWEDIPITRQGEDTTYISARNYPIDEQQMMLSTVWDTTHRKRADDALRRSEAALRKAQQVAHVGSWTWHIQTNTLEWSDEMYRIFGIGKDEFSGDLGEVIANAIHPDDRPAVEASNLSVLNDKKPIPLEYRVVRSDGTVRTVWAEAGELILDEAENPSVLTGITQDITEHKRIEQAIYLMSDTQRQIAQLDNLSEIYQLVGEKVQELVRDGYVVISILDEQTQAMKVVGLYGFGNLYQELSHRFKLDPATFSYPLADMTDDELRRLRSGHLEDFEGGIYALLSRKVPKSICNVVEQEMNISSIHTMGFVWQDRHFGGLTLLAKSDIAPYRDMIETIMNQATTSINRIRAQTALAEERDLLHALMDNIPDGIYFKDAQSRFIRVNRMMARKHGLENPEQAIGTTDFDYFSRETAQRYYEGEQAVIRTGQPEVNVEEEEVWPDRPSTWASTTTMPLRRREGGIDGVIGISRDITKRKQAEKALQRYADRLTILREIDVAILSADSPQEIAQRALRLLDKLVPGQQSSITLFDFEAGEFTRLAVKVQDNQDVLPPGVRSPLEQFFTEWEVLKQDQISVREDLQTLSLSSPILDTLKADGLRSLINVPLVFQSDLIGSLNLAAATPGYFTSEHMEIAREVAGQLAIAIQQARLFEQEREQRTLAESLRDTAEIVHRSLDLNEVLQQILDSVSRLVPHDAAIVWLVEDGVARAVGSAGYADRGGEEALRALRLSVADTQNLHEAQQSGKPVVIRDTDKYPGWVSTQAAAWVRSVITVPVRVRDHTIGYLNLVSAAPDLYTAADGERLQTFANQAATAIQNARLYEELETYSSILEQAVRERTADLQEVNDNLRRFTNLAVDRELRMVELKQEIEELKTKLQTQNTGMQHRISNE